MWAQWSECGVGEERVRKRHCLSDQPSQCRGLDVQRESCKIINCKCELSALALSALHSLIQNIPNSSTPLLVIIYTVHYIQNSIYSHSCFLSENCM